MTQEALTFVVLYLAGSLAVAWDLAFGEFRVVDVSDDGEERRLLWLEMLFVAFWLMVLVTFFLSVISCNSGE